MKDWDRRTLNKPMGKKLILRSRRQDLHLKLLRRGQRLYRARRSILNLKRLLKKLGRSQQIR